MTSPIDPHRDLFIGGRWRPSVDRRRIEVVDPATGTVIGSVADAGVEDAVSAVSAAAGALPPWAATPPRRRSEVLQAAFELMTERAEDLAQLIALENGKSLVDARNEVHYAAEFFRWYAEEAVRMIGEISVAPSGANRIVVQHQPIGVALLVTPWNFPAAMATRKIAPALAAGCTVVLKPASATPLTAYAIAELMADAGVPEGVVNVVTTSDSARVVGALLHDDRIRKLSFTGSTEVGRLLLREAADSVVSCAMELGGNAPVIVLSDADLDVAMEGIMVAKLRNGGQACTAANRIYVHTSLHDELARRLADEFGRLVVGPGTDPDTQCGPLIDEASVRKAEDLVADARGLGADLLVGGITPDGPGTYYLPTVLANVSSESRLVREEIFGPVAALIPFDEVDDAVRAANATEYGLAAYVFTRDLGVGMRIAESIEAGMVAINRGLVSDPAAPFGGVKQSGLGREGAHEGLLEFTEAKYIAVDW